MSAPNVCYSFGYFHRRVEELVELAERLDAVVVDCRYRPWSRFQDWNRERLRGRLGRARYVHIVEFGNTNWSSTTALTVLANVEAGLAEVAPIVARQPIILLCLEPRHKDCHRSIVADAIAARFGCPVVPLEAEKPASHPSQERLI